MIAYTLAILALLLCFTWVYLIYRLVSAFFLFMLIKDELSITTRRYASFWGATGAILISSATLLIETSNQREVHVVMGVLTPFLEEVAKGLAPLFAYMRLSNASGRTLLVIGALTGAGFYLTETFIAILAAAIHNSEKLGIELSIRAVSLCFLHPLSTAFTGLGLGLAASSKHWYLKAFAIMIGYTLGTLLHMWNNIIALAISNGERIDQSEFFSIHLILAMGLLLLARINIHRYKKGLAHAVNSVQ